MVNNRSVILDEGQNKNVKESIMENKNKNYMKACRSKNNRHNNVREWSDETGTYINKEIENLNYKPWTPKIRWWFDECDRKSKDMDYIMIWTIKRINESWLEFQNENLKEILDYLEIIPYTPCIMINISPNWKGKLTTDVSRQMGIKKFKKVIETYLNSCNRYTKWKYVIESGSEDNFIHSHIVAEINPDQINSVLNGKNSHIRKGNHTQELRKIWDKVMPEGFVGYLKGKYSIQTTILRTEQLKKDKLDYLIEDLKPEGHKNKVNLGILIGDL